MPGNARPDEKAMAKAESYVDSFTLLEREQAERKHLLPTPTTEHRLPLSWHQNKVQELKGEARARGVDGGLFLTNHWNLIYATGLVHTATERPFACFLPMDDDDACIWLHPYLDEDLVKQWWCTDNYSYFDYPESRGPAPYQGRVEAGLTRSVFSWWGEVLSRLGYGDKTIGIDSGSMSELGIVPGQERSERLDMFALVKTPTAQRPQGGPFGLMADAMPGASFVDIYDILIRHRAVKDDRENALVQRAMDYSSEIHAFARNYIVERGPGVLDWEVANAASEWGMHRVMGDIPQTGQLHEAVGVEMRIHCRSGLPTAYPHPNQVRWTRIQEGYAIQLAGVFRVGGYGGEQYRSLLVAPWSDWQKHVWDVHTQSYHLQAERSYAGNTCSDVAQAVHEHQVANGCGHLIYHRPGHGEGMEGHQPPYQSLGDYTVMRKGMHFSNEPGLYDPEHGFGFNHGNNILVGEKTGLQMGTAPISQEWCLLRF